MPNQDHSNRRFLCVAIAQLDCNLDADIKKRLATNLHKLTSYTELIASLRHPDLIVFPEVFIQGPDGAHSREMAEPIPSGPTTQALLKLANEQKVWLVPGTLFEKARTTKSITRRSSFRPKVRWSPSTANSFPRGRPNRQRWETSLLFSTSLARDEWAS